MSFTLAPRLYLRPREEKYIVEGDAEIYIG
jgi:hypothetical protein